ncbi:basic salivary proline-rich protein 2-like [Hippopotamus amphibius kiboko]|uniref:basic salivary proline-rich protein 2-like n=1 Tax=Hippopotamus amphibius kiboko TaxID=575201 RepID=UPI002591B895|nr:basic salivary proline-rich protein 2-like [Hippopotamus amphibius kiboko]
MERLPLPNAGKGHGDRMGGNAGNAGSPHGPPHPEGHPRRKRYWPPRRPKSTPELERKKLHLWLPRGPPGGGAGGAEAQSRRFPAEGQQQLRSAAGEGGTQPSPPARPQPGPGPPAPPAARPATRPRLREGRGRLAEGSPCLRPGRCPGPASSPAAPARPPRRRTLTSGCAGRDGPAEPPAAVCVSAPRETSQRRLVRAAEARSSAESGSSGSSQHPGPRTRNYFPTRSPSRSPAPAATTPRLPRRRCATGTASAASRPLRGHGRGDARGIPPLEQVVPGDGGDPASTQRYQSAASSSVRLGEAGISAPQRGGRGVRAAGSTL